MKDTLTSWSSEALPSSESPPRKPMLRPCDCRGALHSVHAGHRPVVLAGRAGPRQPRLTCCNELVGPCAGFTAGAHAQSTHSSIPTRTQCPGHRLHSNTGRHVVPIASSQASSTGRRSSIFRVRAFEFVASASATHTRAEQRAEYHRIRSSVASCNCS